MALIKFDFESLAEHSAEIGAKINEIDALYLRLQQLTERIAASWHGAASEQYVLMMKSYSKQILLYKQVLQEFKKYADTAAKRFAEKDSNAANRIRGIF